MKKKKLRERIIRIRIREIADGVAVHSRNRTYPQALSLMP